MRYSEPERAETDGMMAEVEGTIALEDECLYLDLGGNPRAVRPILWPASTRWDGAKASIVTPTGQEVAIGDFVVGAGGFLSVDMLVEAVDDAGLDRLRACVRQPDDQVAVFNNHVNAVELVERAVGTP